MSSRRAQMIDAMIPAGLAKGTREAYVRAMKQLAAYYLRAPDQLSEEEVRRNLLDLRQRGVASGTFQIARCVLQFFFCRTLGRAWALYRASLDVARRGHRAGHGRATGYRIGGCTGHAAARLEP